MMAAIIRGDHVAGGVFQWRGGVFLLAAAWCFAGAAVAPPGQLHVRLTQKPCNVGQLQNSIWLCAKN